MTHKDSNAMDFSAALAEKAGIVNKTLGEMLDKHTDIPEQLKTAIRYTIDAPGKRIRAALVLWSYELIAGLIDHNARIAAAIAVALADS